MVTLLVGMIASGKDTFTRMLAERGTVVVNDDDIVKAVHGGNYALYNKKLKSLYKAVEATIILSALNEGHSVVINRPNYKLATRQRYLRIAATFDAPVVAVVFPKESPEVHARRRTDHDSRGYNYDYWVEVAKRHASEWQEPKLEEGFSNIVPVHVAKQMLLADNW